MRKDMYQFIYDSLYGFAAKHERARIQIPEHPGGKNYARKQAKFWAYKPSHKLKRKL